VPPGAVIDCEWRQASAGPADAGGGGRRSWIKACSRPRGARNGRRGDAASRGQAGAARYAFGVGEMFSAGPHGRVGPALPGCHRLGVRTAPGSRREPSSVDLERARRFALRRRRSRRRIRPSITVTPVRGQTNASDFQFRNTRHLRKCVGGLRCGAEPPSAAARPRTAGEQAAMRANIRVIVNDSPLLPPRRGVSWGLEDRRFLTADSARPGRGRFQRDTEKEKTAPAKQAEATPLVGLLGPDVVQDMPSGRARGKGERMIVDRNSPRVPRESYGHAPRPLF